MVNIVNKIKTAGSSLTTRQTRFRCYIVCATHILENKNKGYRMRLRWYVESIVRITFPKDGPAAYTGFNYGHDMCPYAGDSNDTE